jgi:hypothetical protein
VDEPSELQTSVPPALAGPVPPGWVSLEEVQGRCVRRGVLPPLRTVLHLGERLAAALAYVHGLPDSDPTSTIVHWDASAAQVLFGPGGHIGMSVASAPPRGEGEDSETPSDELVALGALLYETLTGAPPASLEDEDVAQPPIAGTPLVEPSALRPDVPSDLDATILGCLAAQGYDPISSAEVLRERLAALLEKQSEHLSYRGTISPQAQPQEVGADRVTSRFLLQLFPDRPSHHALSVTAEGSEPTWAALAHRMAAPNDKPSDPAKSTHEPADVPLGNEWDLSFDSERDARPDPELMDPFIQGRGGEDEAYLGSPNTPHRLLWAALAILGPLAILALGQVLTH